MLAARHQAELYAKALPIADGWPPFLLVVDVGYSFELYADFSLTGKNYAQFPDKNTYRLRLSELAAENIRTRLQTVWLDPLSLDPDLSELIYLLGMVKRTHDLSSLPISPNQKAEGCNGSRLCTVSLSKLPAHVQ
jgi:hypothetical protein